MLKPIKLDLQVQRKESERDKVNSTEVADDIEKGRKVDHPR